MLNFGDCIIVDGVYGILMQKSGHSKTIMVFEKHQNQLVATKSTYTSTRRMEKFKLLAEPSEDQLWCESAVIAGSTVSLEWIHPADIIDVVFPVNENVEPEAMPASVSSIKPPRTPRTRQAKQAETPSRGRKFNMTPKKLFQGGGNISDFDDSEHEFSSDDAFSEEDEPEFKAAPASPKTPKKRGRPPKPKSTTTTASPKKARAAAPKIEGTPNLAPVTPRKRKIQIVAGGVNPVSQKWLPESPHKGTPLTPRHKARNLLHAAAVPESLPCRTAQFSRLFSKLQEAIKNLTGTCIYLSGTPGTGKSSTVREVIEQLMIRKEDGELNDFDILDINGMRLSHATLAYDVLYDHLHSASRIATKNAMTALERQFNDKNNGMNPLIVVMEELDQLITKDQSVIYNFFNWPTLPHSRLIVIAVSNTLDMPERFLQNKIKSRLGLENIKFPGYSQVELREILNARLVDSDLVMDDAIEYVARKVGNVSGDARRALDICRRAVEITPDGEPVTLDRVLQVIKESQQMLAIPILKSLSISSKILLLGFFQYSKREPGLNSYPTISVLQQCQEFVESNTYLSRISNILFRNHRGRIGGYQHSMAELLEGGLITVDNVKGDATSHVRLNIDFETAKDALNDEELNFSI